MRNLTAGILYADISWDSAACKHLVPSTAGACEQGKCGFHSNTLVKPSLVVT